MPPADNGFLIELSVLLNLSYNKSALVSSFTSYPKMFSSRRLALK
jgi:hypothetical protein